MTDRAAVSFARERERALARLDHTASIIRLRRAMMVGVPVWLSAMLLELLDFGIAQTIRASASPRRRRRSRR